MNAKTAIANADGSLDHSRYAIAKRDVIAAALVQQFPDVQTPRGIVLGEDEVWVHRSSLRTLGLNGPFSRAKAWVRNSILAAILVSGVGTFAHAAYAYHTTGADVASRVNQLRGEAVAIRGLPLWGGPDLEFQFQRLWSARMGWPERSVGQSIRAGQAGEDSFWRWWLVAER